MKKFKLIPLAVLGSLVMLCYSAIGQQTSSNIPQMVKSSFSGRYARANVKKWKVEKDTCITLFTFNKRKYTAYYTMDGNWVRTERTIKHKSSLPIAARSYLKNSKYASWYVDRLRKVQTPQQTMYVAHIDNHSGNPNQYEGAGSAADKWLYFDSSGKLIKAN